MAEYFDKMSSKPSIVEQWFSLKRNELINSRLRISQLEIELKNTLNENEILREKLLKYENTDQNRINKKRVSHYYYQLDMNFKDSFQYFRN